MGERDGYDHEGHHARIEHLESVNAALLAALEEIAQHDSTDPFATVPQETARAAIAQATGAPLAGTEGEGDDRKGPSARVGAPSPAPDLERVRETLLDHGLDVDAAIVDAAIAQAKGTADA